MMVDSITGILCRDRLILFKGRTCEFHRQLLSLFCQAFSSTSIVSWSGHILCVLVLLSLLHLFLSVLLSLLLWALGVLHMIFALWLVRERPGDQMGLSQLFLPTCLPFSHIHALTQHRRLDARARLLHRFQRRCHALFARYLARVYLIAKAFLALAYALFSFLTSCEALMIGWILTSYLSALSLYLWHDGETFLGSSMASRCAETRPIITWQRSRI